MLTYTAIEPSSSLGNGIAYPKPGAQADLSVSDAESRPNRHHNFTAAEQSRLDSVYYRNESVSERQCVAQYRAVVEQLLATGSRIAENGDQNDIGPINYPVGEVGPGLVLWGGARLGARLADPVAPLPGNYDHVRVSTSDEPWEELLNLPATQAPGSLSQPFALCVEIHVHSGAVALSAATHSKLRAQYEDEWSAYPTDRPLMVILPVEDPNDFAGLAIRNFVEGWCPAEVTLMGISAYTLELPHKDVFLATQDSMSVAVQEAFAADFDDRGFEILRGKWSELPIFGADRITSHGLKQLSDAELIAFYDRAAGAVQYEQKAANGQSLISHWPYALYRESFRGKRVLDVGSGLGYDALWFAGLGAEWTCLDIVESNLENIRRISSLRGLSVTTHYLRDLSSIDELGEFDVIWCHGSMINAPYSFSARESRRLLEHLPAGGRWIELCYPKVRWQREGCRPYYRWGEKTDGIGTPWMEWYDTEKLLQRLEPGRFQVYLSLDIHNADFNWFDLLRIG